MSSQATPKEAANQYCWCDWLNESSRDLKDRVQEALIHVSNAPCKGTTKFVVFLAAKWEMGIWSKLSHNFESNKSHLCSQVPSSHTN